MKVKINIKKFLVRIVLLLLIGLMAGLFVANKTVKKYGYTGIKEVVTTYFSNKKLAKTAKPKVLKIKMAKKDFDFIKKKRDMAIDRGVQSNEGDNYVACELTLGDKKTTGLMRLKGHMTDHLQGDKWSYRIKADEDLMGMYRFTIQHPGTRNYIYEWVYHQLLKHEGVIALNYDFIKVELNNKDLGIYALEEHFGQHVLKRNNRPKGMIIRWNPNLYWHHRMNQYHKEYVPEDYSGYLSSFAEPYDKGVMKKDPELLDNYLTISKLLQEFRSGAKKTSEVFDIEKMARFHAVIDLVGGHHSLDWSDVKLYYNSDTKKIEPVGYESFSIRKTERLAGQQTYSSYDSLQFEYHAQLFNDPVFFREYIKNLERMATEKYVSEFVSTIKDEFNEKLSILSLEWPYRKFDFEGYFENVRLINKNLKLPKPVHAFVQSNNQDSLVLSLAPVSDFPIEIIGVKKKNKIIQPLHPMVLPPKARQTVLAYREISFLGDFEKIKKVVLLAKIPGSSHVFEVELARYPKYKKEDAPLFLEKLKVDTSAFHVEGKHVYLKNQQTAINAKTIIPSAYTMHVLSGQELLLNDSLIINGDLESHGFEDNPCLIRGQHGGKIFLQGKMKATHTTFTGEELLHSNRADILLYQCFIYDIDNTWITDYQSTLGFNSCVVGRVNNLGNFNESEVFFAETSFRKGGNLFNVNASDVKLRDCVIEDYTKIGQLNYQSQITFWRPSIQRVDTLFVMKNASTLSTYGGVINGVDAGVVMQSNDEKLGGKSTYSFGRTKITNCKHIKIEG